MKPHPFSFDAENMMRQLYRRTMADEMRAFKCVLGDLFAEGYTEDDLVDAFNAFMASQPPTHSIRYFRAFLRNRTSASSSLGGAGGTGEARGFRERRVRQESEFREAGW
jgi:hypothetical protein